MRLFKSLRPPGHPSVVRATPIQCIGGIPAIVSWECRKYKSATSCQHELGTVVYIDAESPRQLGVATDTDS
jgi:hypothetical protein